jgi:hypothetical protein
MQGKTWVAAVVAVAALMAPWGGVARAVPICDTSWIGGDGLWSDAAKWSNGVPNEADAARDQACIAAGGTYTVAVKGFRSAAELTLGGGSGVQTLQIQNDNTVGSGRLLLTNQGGMSAEGIRANGVVRLAGSESGYAALAIQGGTLVNKGTIQSLAGAGTDRHIQGNLANDGTLVIETYTLMNFAGSTWVNSGLISIAAGAELSLNVSGGATFIQTEQGTLKIGINSASSFGRLTGAAQNLAGQLVVARKKSYKPGAGTVFSILNATARTGEFAKVVNAVVDKARYFKPTYSSTNTSLVVSEATLGAAPASGPPGTSVALTGSGFPANDSVALKLKDAGGAKTSFGKVTTDASGAFSVSKVIPAGADPGVATLSAKSALTTVTAKAAFTVT